MASKKNIKKRKNKSSGKKAGNFERELERELKYAENWMKERRRFFIKLAFVAGFVILLLVISTVCFRVIAGI